MSQLGIWLEATRPKTLSAALCPVMVGSSLAYSHEAFDWRSAGICLVFALLVQIGTNFANDYLDGIKGTDTKDRIGPRRAVSSGLIPAGTMKMAAIAVLAAAFCFGLLLIPFGGWWLLLVGVASVLCAWLYTGGPYPLAYNGLGDIFVVIFFGFVAVACTYYVQAGGINADALLLGLACGLVINNILVVNNYRDYEEDRAASKRTLVVVFGRRFARMLYLASCCVSAAVLVALVFRQHSVWMLLGCLPLVFGMVNGLRFHRLMSVQQYATALQSSGLIVAAFGLLTSIGLCL